MEPEGSLPNSQHPAICPYPEPYQSTPCPPSHFLKIHFIVNVNTIFLFSVVTLHYLALGFSEVWCIILLRKPGSSVSAVAEYGLDDIAIVLRFPAGAK
jgi:hypothetical protein